MVAKSRHMNICVEESDYNKIKQFADFSGKSIPAMVLDAIWSQIEHHEDLLDIAEYETDISKGTLVTHSWADVKKDAGL